MRRVQLPLGFLVPNTDWKLPDLNDLPQDWNDFSRVAIDTETKDLDIKSLGIGARRDDCYIVGVSLSFENGNSYYLPVRHGGGGNLDPVSVFAYLRHQAANFRGVLVGANLPYELDYLENEAVYFPHVTRFADVLVAEPLIDEHQFKYSLDSVSKKHIGVGKNEDLLTQAARAYGAKSRDNVKEFIWLLPANLVGPYATADAWLPLKTLHIQERIIEEQELEKVWDLECRFLPVSYRMRRRGVRVDSDRLSFVADWAVSEERRCLAEVKRLTGIEIPVGATMQPNVVAPALKAIGVELPTNSKGVSIDALFLDKLNHPVGNLIRRARRVSKIQTTYISQTQQHMTNGRIHATVNQLRASDEDEDEGGAKGTITGRPSCEHPNLYNQPSPKRDPEIASIWRSIYVPEPDTIWASADYSQQEPRWLVEWSLYAGPRRIGIDAWDAANRAAQKYRDDPSSDFHQMVADMAGIPRTSAKAIGLGKIYGMGGLKLCRQLGLPTRMEKKRVLKNNKWVETDQMVEAPGPEGRALMQLFDSKVPFASKMLRKDADQARETGFIRTYSGRRGRFVPSSNGEYMDCHKALNKRIQGSAADQTKEACIQLDAAGIYLQIQIYDETNSSVVDITQAKLVSEIMEHCIKMKVPSKVDLETGLNWGETKKAA